MNSSPTEHGRWETMYDAKLREVVEELNRSAVGRLELAKAVERVAMRIGEPSQKRPLGESDS